MLPSIDDSYKDQKEDVKLAQAYIDRISKLYKEVSTYLSILEIKRYSISRLSGHGYSLSNKADHIESSLRMYDIVFLQDSGFKDNAINRLTAIRILSDYMKSHWKEYTYERSTYADLLNNAIHIFNVHMKGKHDETSNNPQSN